MTKRYWLMKSEPNVYSIHDLARNGVDCWDGVRNYQARNFMRDEMQVGDGVLFYHSNAKPAGVAGLARIARSAYPDHTAFDSSSTYYDPKSDSDNPRWLMVDVEFAEAFASVVSLAVLQSTPGLEDMMVIRRGMRLSIQPVTPAEWDIVVALGRATGPSTEVAGGKKGKSIRGGGAKKSAKTVA